jgi:hypothetical protein
MDTQLDNSTRSGKIFNLTPAVDERTRTILATREQALTDGHLDDGAARMFALLLDLALDPSRNSGSGIVAISQTKLGEKLKCSVRTIYDRTRQLTRARYVWVSQIFLPNMKPMNVYHISALHSPTEREYKTTAEGLWGNGSRQSPWDHSKGVQGGLRQNSAVEGAAGPGGEKSQVLDIAAPSGEQLPLSTAEICRRPRQKSAVAHGENLPVATAEICRWPRQKSAGGHGENLPVATAAACRHKETPDGEKDPKGVSLSLPASLESSADFKSQWQEWLEELHERKQPVTDRSKKLMLEKCAGWGPDLSVTIIKTAIERGWKALYKPDKPNEKRSKSSTRSHQVDRNAGTLNKASAYAHL